MKKSLILMIGVVWFLSFVSAEVSEAQVATNPRGDLMGENMGDNIAFNWADDDVAVQYIVYKSLSINGPWQELGRTADVGIGGAKVDVTPDASLMDLCYMVEAIDALEVVIRTYEPICVPQFVPPLAPAAALTATPNGLCLTETEFAKFDTMPLEGPSGIRQWLIDRGGFLKGQAPAATPPDFTFMDADGIPTDAGQEIFNAAQPRPGKSDGINPRVLLTQLRKEMPDISKIQTRPLEDRVLRRLAGWDTKDAVKPLPQKSAREQIQDMADQLRRDFYGRLSQCKPTLKGWEVDKSRQSGEPLPGDELTAPLPTGQPIDVIPENKIVATFMAYTPWEGVLLGGGYKAGDPILKGGNGRFCELWHQFGWQTTPGALAISQPNPTIPCAPTASRCVSINVSGGTPPYREWSSSKGVITVSGVNSQNIQLTPPVNPNPGLPDDAYIVFVQSVTDCRNPPACIPADMGFRQPFGCNDQPGTCGGFSGGVHPPLSTVSCDGTAPGVTECSCGLPNCASNTCDRWAAFTGNVIDVPGRICKPCRIEMDGATFTVKDSATPQATATTTINTKLKDIPQAY